MSKRYPVWLTRLVVFSLAMSVFAACDDATSPGDVDIQGTQAAVDQVINQFFVENQGLTSLEIFGAQIGTAMPSISPVNLVLTPEEATLHGVASHLRESVGALSTRSASAATLMAIPPQFEGKTFEYNSQTGAYEPTERTGAPAGGIRFILYDGISTLAEVGHLDLIDNSNFGVVPAAIDITLSVFITDVGELLHYRITGSASDTGGTLLVDGFLSDGSDQLDFDFNFSGSDATGVDAVFTLSHDGLTMTLDTSMGPTGAESISIEITNGNDNILFVLLVANDGTVQTGSGIFLGNTPVAVFSGNIGDETFTVTNSDGAPITEEQLIALAEVFTAIEVAFIVMEELFVLGLGLIGIAFFF